MPRRSPLDVETIADFETLTWAFWRARRGHRHQPAVMRFAEDMSHNLEGLSSALRAGHAPAGRWHRFTIHDPKERDILAPCFADRVAHHAMMRHIGPVLERELVDDTYACRTGRGLHAAVRRAQHHLRRFPWFVKVDIRAYFASIDHAIVMSLLRRRFKHPALLALCARVLESSPVETAGVGLPIGALTSQHFANLYLGGADRFLLEHLKVRGMVRYMDDTVWWVEDNTQARQTLDALREHLQHTRRLHIKPTAQIGRSSQGLSFLGFRIRAGTLRLLRRRRRRYAAARRRWERAFLAGDIDAHQLQAGVDAALAITAHADAVAWRQAQLRRCPPVEA